MDKSVILNAAVLLISAAPALAQQPAARGSRLVDALNQCQAIADATPRLTCFDRVSGQIVAATRDGSLAVVDQAELRQARRSLFGFAMPRLPFFAGDRSAEDDRGDLESTIKSARSLGHGKYAVRIADGNALWETIEANSAMNPPQAGQKLTIRRGSLGSYTMRFERDRWVRAKRVG